MRLEQLIYVIEVADVKMINIAAEKIFLTPQNISKSIKQLEDELNIKIFNRTKYGMFLTEDGQLVYNVAKEIQKQTQFLNNIFHTDSEFEDEKIEGNLNIVAPASMGNALHHLLDLFMKKYKDVHISYSEKDSTYLASKISKQKMENFDFIFMNVSKSWFTEYDRFKENYNLFFLFEETMCVLMQINSPLAKQQSISLKTLATLPLAAYSTSIFQKYNDCFIDKILDSYNIKLNYVFISDSMHVWEKYICDGTAYGLVGTNYMKDYSKNHKNLPISTITVPIKEKISTTTILLIPKKETLNPPQQIFLKMIQNYYRDTWHHL